MKEPLNQRQQQLGLKHREVLDRFRDEVCIRHANADELEYLDWTAMSTGWFLCAGVPVDEACELSRMALCHYHYWT